MNRLIVSIGIAAILALGCTAPQTKTGQGAMIGTGVGAAAGAGLGQAIGGNTKSTLIGAGIGAVVGGLAGGSIGKYMDNQEAAMRQQLAGVEAANVQRNANLLAITFKSDFLFDLDSAQLKPGAYDEISRVAQVLVQYPQTNILIAGHTDSSGAEAYNQQLSERRAQVVMNSLAGQGVNPARLTTIGYGESRPIADNNTEAGRQLNRRVEITIAPQQ
ncbi:OmpA family protein [Desulfuromonas carbonis]|uniref:OmpA family protein n=1 Tax=Desulfuromonas sp. DDH964 TaxID=1823759 RepID=UPI00078D29B5|nr:OmpA family protein [Desulfuromonas sp. DDH964]AMV71205.1 peptidoglycan-binding outer membrane protein [Desulfuromonas sp. DDH964]